MGLGVSGSRPKLLFSKMSEVLIGTPVAIGALIQGPVLYCLRAKPHVRVCGESLSCWFVVENEGVEKKVRTLLKV